MKQGWKIKTLGDVCEINLGKTPSRGDKSMWDAKKTTKNVWLSIADLNNSINGIIFDSKEYISDLAAQNVSIVKKGTLLMSFKLTIGRCAFAGLDLRTNEAIASLPLKNNNINLSYLKHYLEGFDWITFAKGDEKVKGITLNKKKLQLVPIIIPPLSEQQRIVEVLDREFERIDTIRKNAETSLQYAKDLMQAKLKEELEPKKGWNKKTIKDICENLDRLRKPVTKKDRIAGDYPYYGASGIVDYVNDYIFAGDFLLVSEDGANLLARSAPIAFSISGKNWVNNHAHILRFENSTTQYFVEYFINSTDISNFVHGAAQPKFTQESLNNFEIFLPSISDQQQIVSRLDRYSEACRQIEENSRAIISHCDALKQALLRKAFDGEL